LIFSDLPRETVLRVLDIFYSEVNITPDPFVCSCDLFAAFLDADALRLKFIFISQGVRILFQMAMALIELNCTIPHLSRVSFPMNRELTCSPTSQRPSC
jgi:hypothetical protein